ncbi:hypothetical protein NLI96_g3178 [Meripilus lineatus]|uniref:Uncharacterized protein n=1 Tax=Meripilus lineatus TaxID=2056292 RepID=A0AAD5V7B1_9APHY|nr:hypothetical protein NLI96_g3178 [Physisporinus lineatus]
MQECQALRAELSRLRPGHSLLHSSTASASAPTTPTPRSRATSPTSPTPYSPSVHSPLASPFATRTITASQHARSASVAPSSGLLHRSATPSVRSQASTAASILRSESARPSTPHKPRRLSISSSLTPPKVIRSTSNESSSDEILSQKERDQEKQKEKDAKRVQLIQRWIPSLESTSPPNTRYLGSAIPTPIPTGRSRIVSASSAATPIAPPFRYKTPLSANSP